MLSTDGSMEIEIPPKEKTLPWVKLAGVFCAVALVVLFVSEGSWQRILQVLGVGAVLTIWYVLRLPAPKMVEPSPRVPRQSSSSIKYTGMRRVRQKELLPARLPISTAASSTRRTNSELLNHLEKNYFDQKKVVPKEETKQQTKMNGEAPKNDIDAFLKGSFLSSLLSARPDQPKAGFMDVRPDVLPSFPLPDRVEVPLLRSQPNNNSAQLQRPPYQLPAGQPQNVSVGSGARAVLAAVRRARPPGSEENLVRVFKPSRVINSVKDLIVALRSLETEMAALPSDDLRVQYLSEAAHRLVARFIERSERSNLIRLDASYFALFFQMVSSRYPGFIEFILADLAQNYGILFTRSPINEANVSNEALRIYNAASLLLLATLTIELDPALVIDSGDRISLNDFAGGRRHNNGYSEVLWHVLNIWLDPHTLNVLTPMFVHNLFSYLNIPARKGQTVELINMLALVRGKWLPACRSFVTTFQSRSQNQAVKTKLVDTLKQIDDKLKSILDQRKPLMEIVRNPFEQEDFQKERN
eukprot:TRINITY_DN8627_c0_g1_i2.p1 TRINITY_DN8627_c0_g1~~TRINITY_DN8627_c0_g1_i2.p1  ORF type:complete len:527 (+),score=97.78 TRINITY_DN8627_c0_g1_i2:118-1698(+)